MTQPTHPHDRPQQEQPPSPTSPIPPQPAADERRGVVVGIGIVLAALLFLLTAGVLYVRWATMREPTCVLIVESPSSLRGAEVTVDGVGLAEPHVATVGVGERFGIPFYLDYGTYRVRVTLRGAPVLETEVTLTRDAPGRRLDLTQVPLPLPSGATSSSTAEAAAPGRLHPPLRVEPDAARGLTPLTPPPGDSRLAP